MPRPTQTLAFALLISLSSLNPSTRANDDEPPDNGAFGFTSPVICKEIRGYEDYDPLPDATLTRDDKLLVYFKPLHYKSAQSDQKFQAHFTQDAKIRRRGQKNILWSKPKILDYKATSATPPRNIFLRNAIALKDLKPGEYELEIVLTDKIGNSEPATRKLFFKVVPAAESNDVKKREKPSLPVGKPGLN